MLRIRTASRLHFGLLRLAIPASTASPLPPRRFGGAGLMIADPGLSIRLTEAASWSVSGPLAERALDFARRYVESRARDGLSAGPPQHVLVENAGPEHAGLGTGTQLGLAVARGLSVAWGHDEDVTQLARRVGRGRRSALGVYGFGQGGFLVDAGKRDDELLAPLIAHAPFPESWRIVLAMPHHGTGLHSAAEIAAFARLAEVGDMVQTDVLCRLVLLGMLPALAERDIDAFGEALYEFNHRVGELFAGVQGGPYAGQLASALVAFVRQVGVRGVGQSSWGPAIFAVVEDDAQARELARRLCHAFGEGIVVTSTTACPTGARVEID
jgi:beta-RFAP synthase